MLLSYPFPMHCRFLGDQTKGINEDRDILVYDTSEGQGESLNQLEDYFHKKWKESCVSIKNGKQSSRYTDAYRHMEEIYISLLKRYNDIETYSFCMNRIIIHQFIHICPCFQNFLFLIKIICTAPWIRAFFHCIQHDLKQTRSL